MGFLTSRKYETLEKTASNGHLFAKTTVAGVEHNGVTEAEQGNFPLGQVRASGPPSAYMANDLLTQPMTTDDLPSTTGHELDAFLGKAFEEKPIWTGLYESIHDLFFPKKLPPLELTSTPIPVPDRMAVKANPWAIGISTSVNIAILAVLLFFVGKKVIETIKKPTIATDIDVGTFTVKAPHADAAGGGGGGGSHDIVDPMKGKLPKKMDNPITPPMVPILDKPKLAFEPAINVQKDITLPDNPTMPTIGVKNSANVTQRLRSGLRRQYRRRRLPCWRRRFGAGADIYARGRVLG